MAFVKAVNQLSEAYYLNHVGYKEWRKMAGSVSGKALYYLNHVGYKVSKAEDT